MEEVEEAEEVEEMLYWIVPKLSCDEVIALKGIINSQYWREYIEERHQKFFCPEA